MSEIIEVDSDVVQVVRCGKCDLRIGVAKNGNLIKCATGRYHEPNWYCADGVKRKEFYQGKDDKTKNGDF